MDTRSGEITLLLKRTAAGDSRAGDALAAAVVDELRRIAARMMAQERPDHTLQATVIADEAFLKLIERPAQNWRDRAHFFAAAAQSMRRILVDYSRQKRTLKRGRDAVRTETETDVAVSNSALDDVLDIDEALTRLSAIDPRQARIVELRYFAGLTEDETAEALSISPRTVKRDWAFARAWLSAELQRSPRKPGADSPTGTS